MLEQLMLLTKNMYRGYYLLDTFKHRAYKEGDHGVSHSFAMSKFSPVKRLRLLRGSSPAEEMLHNVFGSLEITITDSSEFVLFLKSCPPLYRPMYSTYLVLDKCMFGRHVEMEQTINFLMQEQALVTASLDVLPIIGPEKADNLAGRPTSIRDCGSIKYQNQVTERERFIVIIELDADIDEGTWTRVRSAYSRYPANAVKIIISNRSDRIARFGTTRAVRVEYLSQEAYWYFFKSLAFGSMNPRDEPNLASMAMQMAVCLNGCFIAGNIVACMLRANYSAKFWA
ncbi:hypothetical protein PR202_ga30537 [Eleusine coracana subsp. coracana]|uniref:Uncharacterized protein n=1 Tax=Eleusine coracana subsp. coracana TaxID=191504 RepID=A0AAV5DP02_ELECO|nr:hypothetical protein PR202_ga30503 [Eleusine coracana subsp. coracana]GJN12272.1 hypothetical protein PR202_ga30537 [Eleusine coracana subsp. coracana]